MAILNHIHEWDIRAALIIQYRYGCRENEVLALEKQNVEITPTHIKLNISVLKRKEKVLKHVHNLPVNKALPFMDMLEAWLKVAMVQIEGTKLFYFTDRWYRKRFEQGSVKAEVQGAPLYPHFLRHTRATRMAEAGFTITQLQAWFGWKDSKPVMIYVQRSPKLIEGMGDVS
jgi:integrase